MRAFLMQLALPPLVVAAPWAPSAWQRNWTQFTWWLVAWLMAWALTLFLWAGPGFLCLLAMGLYSAFTTKINLPDHAD